MVNNEHLQEDISYLPIVPIGHSPDYLLYF